MTIQLLQERIRDAGAANALIYLDSKHQMRSGTNQITSRGKISRQAPVFDPRILKDLSEKFALGWAALQESDGVDLSELESLIPGVRSLASGEIHKKGESHMLHFPHLGLLYGALNQAGLDALESHEAVADIHYATLEPDLIRPPAAGKVASIRAGEVGWGIQKMGAFELWEQNLTGTGILIAHLDTGADSQHPALEGSITDTILINKLGKQVAPPNPFTDSDTKHGHGTHTASVLVGRQIKGGPIIGMAPGAELACAMVVPGKSEELVARFLGGLEWSLTTEARILNLSIGVPRIDRSFEGVIEKLRAKHILPIAATGNSGPVQSYSPGNYRTVLSVGAVDKENEMAPFSGKATYPSVSAPGMEVYSAAPASQYAEEMGTSIAVPHVAGLAALLFDAKPLATIDQIQEAIIASCDNPKSVDCAWIGAGIPNGVAALNHLNEITR